MIRYVLFLVTLNVQTGEFVQVEVVGRPFANQVECLRAAIEKGPQLATSDGVRIYSCGVDTREVRI